MATKRAFISFDFPRDAELRDALVGQSKYPNSPFTIADWSVHEAFTGDWESKVRRRIQMTNLTIVLCGEYTNASKGVAAELRITREENKPYFLLRGRPNKDCTRPLYAHSSDKIYTWKWDNLRNLIAGYR